jgi:hypothetical protein
MYLPLTEWEGGKMKPIEILLKSVLRVLSSLLAVLHIWNIAFAEYRSPVLNANTKTFSAEHLYYWHTWGRTCGPWEQMKVKQGAEDDAMGKCYSAGKVSCSVLKSWIVKNGDLQCDEIPECSPTVTGVAYSGCKGRALVNGQ